MIWGRGKLNAKLAENQPSLTSFPATSPFSSFSLCCGLQPPPPSSPVHLRHLHLKHPSKHHTWWLHHFSLSLSSVKLFSSATMTLGAAPATTTSSRSFWPSQRPPEQQLSPQPQPAAGLTTSSHTVCYQSGCRLLQCQVSLPPLFFFFFPSLPSLHVNSAMWIIIHVALFHAT